MMAEQCVLNNFRMTIGAFQSRRTPGLARCWNRNDDFAGFSQLIAFCFQIQVRFIAFWEWGDASLTKDPSFLSTATL
jgi:hypothetical protein